MLKWKEESAVSGLEISLNSILTYRNISYRIWVVY